VNVQAMVFGNMGETSGTGVGFTRNPSTGAKEFYGEFLLNAQAKMSLAGIRTPVPLIELERVMPKCYKQLRQITTNLESTIATCRILNLRFKKERSTCLQTRNGNRTRPRCGHRCRGHGSEKLISAEDAVHARGTDAIGSVVASGAGSQGESEGAHERIAASPGAASGRVVFSSDDAVSQSGKSRVILVP